MAPHLGSHCRRHTYYASTCVPGNGMSRASTRHLLRSSLHASPSSKVTGTGRRAVKIGGGSVRLPNPPRTSIRRRSLRTGSMSKTRKLRIRRWRGVAGPEDLVDGRLFRLIRRNRRYAHPVARLFRFSLIKQCRKTIAIADTDGSSRHYHSGWLP